MFQRNFRSSLCLAMLAVCGAAMAETSYYVVAHEDDWQLFMGNNAYEDVESGVNTVFIYLTAGDAGAKAGGYGTLPYYRAREEGAKESLRLPTGYLPGPFPTESFARVTVNRKSVMRWVYKNTTSYFLRLPDGNVDGKGYSTTGQMSLARLRMGLIPGVTAVDNSATYKTWTELVTTVQAILQASRASDPDIWINTHDTDPIENEGTHSDHYYAGMLAQHAGLPLGANFALWKDYISGAFPPNLSTRAIINKAGLFGVLAANLNKYKYDTTFEPGHQQWLDRGYFRVRPTTEPIP